MKKLSLFLLLLCAALLFAACGGGQPAVVTPAPKQTPEQAAPAPEPMPEQTAPEAVPTPEVTPEAVPTAAPAPAPARVTVSYAEEGTLPEKCSVFVADGGEYAVQLVCAASGPVTDFRVLSLVMTDFRDDGPVFAETELYRQETLTPGCPLAVTLTFAGDLPNNGISYVDDTGETLRFALSMSGEDGSLLLEAY